MYTFSAASSRSFQVFSLNLNTPWGLRATIREVETTSLEIIFVKGDFINIIPKDIFYSHLYNFLLDISIMDKFIFFIFFANQTISKIKSFFSPRTEKGCLVLWNWLLLFGFGFFVFVLRLWLYGFDFNRLNRRYFPIALIAVSLIDKISH
jgi:hypothetical protein